MDKKKGRKRETDRQADRQTDRQRNWIVATSVDGTSLIEYISGFESVVDSFFISS